MFAQPRRRRGRIGAHPVEAHRGADHRHFAQRARPARLPCAAMHRLGVGKRFRHRVDRPRRNARLEQFLHPVRRRRIGDDRADLGDDRLAVRDPRRIGREPLVRRPFGMPADRRQFRELAIVAHRDHQRLVGRHEGLVRHDIGVAVPLPHRVLARHHRVGRLVRQHRQLRVEQAHVDMRALARPLPLDQRGLDRVGRIEPREEVRDRHADPQGAAVRFLVGQPRQAHHPAHRLDDVVVPRPRRVRPVLPETRDRTIDQPRVARAQARRVEPMLLQPADAVIFDHHVRLARHPPQDCRSLGLREVERHAPLPPVGGKEIGRDPFLARLVPRRPPVARVVPGAGLFHLGHFRAEVGEQLRAPRPRQNAAQVEHANPLKRSMAHAAFLHLRRSAHTACAALWPGAPVTPPPGCAPEPHR